MYKDFYGLEENPFKLTPTQKSFFVSSQAKKVIGLLHYGLKQNVGFLMLTGEVGVGKTSLIRYFLSTLDDETERAYLINPTFATSEDLLESLLLDYEIIKTPSNETKAWLLRKLHNFLFEKYQENKKVLLIIDDAQACPDFILEELRLLSNFETDEEKLIQILLVGQPELKEKLNSLGLRQLRQRIGLQIEIRPFNLEDTVDYINLRTLKAGATQGLFTFKAIKLIHKKTKGVPRLINLLAERALLAGYIRSKIKIDKKDVKLALKEITL